MSGIGVTSPLNDPDITEKPRRARIAVLAAGEGDREALERRHGTVWDPPGLAADFDVIGFMAPYVVVIRRTDGRKGSLEFRHDPRFYFNWRVDR